MAKTNQSKFLAFLKPDLGKVSLFIGLILFEVITNWYILTIPYSDMTDWVILLTSVLYLPVWLLLCPETFESGKSTCGTFIDKMDIFGGFILIAATLFYMYLIACAIVMLFRKIRKVKNA
jgi:hypothetical protein